MQGQNKSQKGFFGIEEATTPGAKAGERKVTACFHTIMLNDFAEDFWSLTSMEWIDSGEFGL